MIFVESCRDVNVEENEKHHILFLRDVTDNEESMLLELGYKYASTCDGEDMFVKTEEIWR